MTTYRLTTVDSDGTSHVQEFDDYPQVMQALMGRVPWHDEPRAVLVQQLAAFEPTTWGQVLPGDEVKAPNGSVWLVEDARAEESGIRAFEIVNINNRTSTTTRPQPAAEVLRRRGPLAVVRQMLADIGIATVIMK